MVAGAQPDAAAPAEEAPEAQDGEAGGVTSHASHHRMIARNLNALLENFGEFRNETIAETRELKRELKRLDAKIFRLENAVGQLSSKHDKFLEEMTTVAFDTNLDLRGALNHVEGIWKTLLEIAGDGRATVERNKQAVEESEERRVAAIDRKLSDLAAEAEKDKKARNG